MLLDSEYKDRTKLWRTLLHFHQESYLIGCSVSARGIKAESESSNGLLYNHAYGVLDVQEVQGHRLLRLRNPWGKKEWNGRWADGSREWTPALLKHFDHEFGDDGTFFICFEDFVSNFNKLHVLRLLTDDVGEKWDKFACRSEWKGPDRAGGCMNHVTFLKNPQFVVRTTQPSRVFVSVSQPCLRYAGRAKKGPAGEMQYQSIGITILRHSSTPHRLSAFPSAPH